MRSTRRAAALVAMCTALSLTGPAAAAARLTSITPATATAHATLVAVVSPTAISSSPAPCSDTKYNLIGAHWTSTLRWRFKASTTPSYLNAGDVATILKRGFANITHERNDCGRSDHVSATQSYLGTTTRAIGVTKYGRCGTSDGANTVGFGALPAGVLALTCVRSIGSRIVESDIRFSNSVTWALSLGSCSNDYMLEAVITHEAGHAYGLDHVGETNHGRLTMSTFIDGVCENQESTLGNGDMKGLEVMY